MKYDRLTKRFTGGSPYSEYASNYDILCRLAELEDKIEQGTLIELPCLALSVQWFTILQAIKRKSVFGVNGNTVIPLWKFRLNLKCLILTAIIGFLPVKMRKNA